MDKFTLNNMLAFTVDMSITQFVKIPSRNTTYPVNAQSVCYNKHGKTYVYFRKL